MAGFARALREDAAARADRFGVTAYLLEPDLKQGAGGLRDLQAVRWVASVAGDSPRAHAPNGEALADAEEFLTRARSALQFETGKRGDRLPLELQPPIAQAMGFTDEPRLIAEDGLMRAVFEHARAVRWIAANVLARAEAGTSMPTEDPVALRRRSTPLSRRWLPRPRQARPPAAGLLDSRRSDRGARAGGVDRPDPRGVHAHRARRGSRRRRPRRPRPQRPARPAPARLGRRAMPAPARPVPPLHGRHPSHDRTGRDGAPARRDADDDDPLIAGALSHGPDRDGLLLGALLHDIGKTGEGGHVPAGSRIAGETLDRMGVRGPTRDLAAFMVAEHLLLPDTATRRDLTDENLVLDVAARVGSPERLAALTLLAKADATATGPAAWTPWRQTLLRELVTRVHRVYDRGDMGLELAQQLTDQGGGGARAARPASPSRRSIGSSSACRAGTSSRSSPTASPGTTRRSLPTSARARCGPRRSRARSPARTSYWSSPPTAQGLLATIAGAVALAGLSILTAQAFTTDDGVAVDLFEVEGVFEPEIDESRWREFRGVLRKAVEGRLSLDHRVAERRARYPAPRADSPVTVAVDNEASDYSTVIEVGAPDRIGLLYDITSALADLTLDVHLAKVATYTDRVIDAFYVRDALGRKVTDRAQVAEIESAVRAHLAVVAGSRAYRWPKRASTSGKASNRENEPSVAISSAACRNPPHAVRASVPPTLMRRTPRSAASATVRKGALISRLTGLGDTAATIGGDVLGADARSVEAVRSGLGICAQPPDRLVDVGTPAHESLGPPGQHDAGAALVDGTSRGPDTLDGQVELEERLRLVARGILDRETGDACRDGQLDVLTHLLRIDGVGALEVGVHRNRHGLRDITEMLERLIQRHVIVRVTRSSMRTRRSSSRAPRNPSAPALVRFPRPRGSASRSSRLRAVGGTQRPARVARSRCTSPPREGRSSDGSCVQRSLTLPRLSRAR